MAVKQKSPGNKNTANLKSGSRRVSLERKAGKIRDAGNKCTRMAAGSWSATTRIRRVGNQNGVILNNQLIEKAGINTDADIVIQAADGVIIIAQVKDKSVNTDLSTWDKQFKTAIKNGAKPEEDLFEGMSNNFDLNEW